MRKLYLIGMILMMLALVVTACGGNNNSTSNSNSGNTTSTGSSDTKKEIKPSKLLFGIWVPATHFVTEKSAVPWAEVVKEKTNGAVTIDIMPGAVLGGTTSSLNDVSGGVYDIGLTALQWSPDTPFFKATILDLPFAFINQPDHLSSLRVADRFVNEVLKDDFEEMNLKYMGIYNTDATALLSTKPIRSLEDMKGMKIGLQGYMTEKLLQAWGASPASIALADVYISLERGTIDAQLFSPSGVPVYKMWEPAPYFINFGVSKVNLIAIMNLDKFNALDPSIQAQFDEELNADLASKIGSTYVDVIAGATDEIKAGIAGKGEVIELADEEKAKLIAPVKDIWTEWINEANKKGYDGQGLVDTFWNMLQEEGIEPPFQW